MAVTPPALPLAQVAAPSLLVQSDPKLLPNGQLAYRNSVFLQLPDTPAGQPATSAEQLAPWVDGVGKLATQLLLAGQWPHTPEGLPVTSGDAPTPAKPLAQPWQRQA
jgi:hypothetical protein